MQGIQARIAELTQQLDSRKATLTVRYMRIESFFTPEMNEFMAKLVGERWEFSEINDLVVEIEDEFGIVFDANEFRAVRRYVNIYLNVLDTMNKLERALKRA